MARFTVNGMDVLTKSMDDLAHLGAEDRFVVLEAGARVVQEHLTEILKTRFRVISGHLSDSLQYIRKYSSVMVQPVGDHDDRMRARRRAASYGPKPPRKSGKPRKPRKLPQAHKTTNAEVAYYLEYGSPRIDATHWMETGVEECAEETTNAMAEAWDELLREKGL